MKHEQLFQRLNELSVKQLEFQRRVSEIAQPTLTQPKVAYPRNTQLIVERRSNLPSWWS